MSRDVRFEELDRLIAEAKGDRGPGRPIGSGRPLDRKGRFERNAAAMRARNEAGRGSWVRANKYGRWVDGKWIAAIELHRREGAV